MDLRAKLATDLLRLKDDDATFLLGLADQSEDEPAHHAISRYVQKFKLNGTFFSEFELRILAKSLGIGLQIIVTDPDYPYPRTIPLTIGSTTSTLLFNQGKAGVKGDNGHYDGTVLDETNKEGLRKAIEAYLGISSTNVQNDFRLAIWNCRSIREIIKKSFLCNALLLENIAIAFIN